MEYLVKIRKRKENRGCNKQQTNIHFVFNQMPSLPINRFYFFCVSMALRAVSVSSLWRWGSLSTEMVLFSIKKTPHQTPFVKVSPFHCYRSQTFSSLRTSCLPGPLPRSLLTERGVRYASGTSSPKGNEGPRCWKGLSLFFFV